MAAIASWRALSSTRLGPAEHRCVACNVLGHVVNRRQLFSVKDVRLKDVDAGVSDDGKAECMAASKEMSEVHVHHFSSM